MKRSAFLLLLGLTSIGSVVGQQGKQRVFFSDIDNFWVAYDSIRTTTDSLQQLRYFHRLYINKGTAGLKAFMEVKGYTPEYWVHSIRQYPKFWNSIRPNTQWAKTSARGIEPYLKKFAALYPALRPASMYFTIGALRSNGTTKKDMVLIGAEMTTGTPDTDISEFPPATQTFLARYFRSQPLKNIVVLNVHEYVHTQEKGPPESTLLAQALYEGTCDVVAELITGKLPLLPYMAYGPTHEAALKERFKAEMFSPYLYNWFYNQTSDDPNHVPDLGYYMGYAICKTYYQHAKDKKQAVKELIELDYTNETAVESFLRKSAYYPELPSKALLLETFENNRPVVTRVPTISADGYVDASVTELQVDFSTAMAPNTSTDYGPGGKEQWPIIGSGIFAADKKSFTYKVALQPGHTYSFVLNGGGFRSTDGRPLRPYEVKFKTKAR
ncbi:hypothetical protein MTX78_24490 (plasmid) [Hymenobacter tibetensis]|uniref:SbsA Ig-like domain-containing protein n=1 Tax=Hymenobacter tibetensis TaxID=497967 RepID=A0ABY4D6B2_9BACT|nr:hypothetical protein [Hymenobacter tibetensis]UOG77577.1 hypothetical protein MTX78_24490 [Hymenobacter tibetensis]